MIKGGPRVVTDGLVLCLDVHDAKSYAGEPVTNLVTSTAVDFSVRSTYSGNTFSQVADSESPSGYACEMSYTGTVNSSSRCRFGGSNNIPTSGTGFVSIWAKRSAGTSTMRPKVYTGYAWYHLEPLDGGSIYFTDEYRPFGVAVTFGTNSGGPNPGFSMTHAGGSTENDKTRWIKPQVTTLSYNIPFANLSRSATNGWVDRSGNSNSGTLTNMVGTGASHYRDGQVIMPVANSYLDFDGSNDNIDLTSHSSAFDFGTGNFSVEAWVNGAVNNNYRCIFWHHYNPGFTLITTYGQSPNGAPRFWLGGTVLNGTTSILDGTWHHVLVTRNGADVNIYVDGSQNNSSSAFSGKSATPGTAQAAIGQYNVTSSSYPFDGKIAVVRVYNKALTAAEVLSNYNATKGRFS